MPSRFGSSRLRLRPPCCEEVRRGRGRNETNLALSKAEGSLRGRVAEGGGALWLFTRPIRGNVFGS